MLRSGRLNVDCLTSRILYEICKLANCRCLKAKIIHDQAVMAHLGLGCLLRLGICHNPVEIAASHLHQTPRELVDLATLTLPKLNNTQISISSRQIHHTQLQRSHGCCISWSSSCKSRCSTRKESTRWPCCIRLMGTRNRERMPRAREWKVIRRYSFFNRLSSDTGTCIFWTMLGRRRRSRVSLF